MKYEGIDKWNSQDSLQHYGVIGMKWGMRKAEARGEQYKYRSIGQKLKQRKVNKLSSKLKSTTNIQRKTKLATKLARQTTKLNNLKARDTRRQEYARTASVGGAVARTVLFGPIGNGTYERFRSAGSSTVEAGAAAVAATLFAPVAGAVASKVIENNSDKYYGAARNRTTRR